MTNKSHALLCASGSKRWLSCPPSARLEENFPDNETEAAQEGTLAHSIAEIQLNAYLADIDVSLPEEITASRFYSKSMLDYVAEYTDLGIEKINTALKLDKDAHIAVEQKIDYGGWAQEGFGTGDLIIITGDYIEIVDLKYGKGVPVSATGNTQMRMYALGLYDEFYWLYGFEKVRMTIVQPRNGGISEEEISIEELLNWGETVVKPKARLAFKGEGELCAGKWCRFCRAAKRCRAYADYCMELARLDFKDPDLLTDEELAESLRRIDDLVKYANNLKHYALAQALSGNVLPGFKLVEGRSSRKYTDAEAVIERLIFADYAPEDYFNPQELKSLTELTKSIGKKAVDTVLSDLIIKPPGKPALVPEDDPRPEYNCVENDFEILD
ncbi:MAG TPA: DUF2800 domain-containing protein [Candidatus Megamonas gallistercoris]|nr:DUF2800 domain-containing protein [Candidatus Megamonas gallistercoris]